MSSFDFKKWCSDNGLKESTIETLRRNDLDSQDALKLVHADDVGTLDLTLGQRRLFMQALNLLNGNDQDQKTEEKHPSQSTPVTTKSLANDYPRLAKVHINLQETFTVLLALGRWKDQLRDKWIVVRTDSTTTLSAINKATSSNQLNHNLLRYVVFLARTLA